MRQIKNPLLHRYWIDFEPPEGERPWPMGMSFGCGVTAYDPADALQLLTREFARFGSSLRSVPPVRRLTVDVDVQSLDRGHVRPNMGVVIWRGVWFPNLGPAPR